MKKTICLIFLLIPLTLNAISLESKNAATLDGQSASFYQNSSNQNAGTLPNARLDSEVEIATKLGVGGGALKTWTLFTPITNHRGVIAGRSDTAELDMFMNIYYNGGYKYMSAGAAGRLFINSSGDLSYNTAGVGAEDGAVSQTTRFKVDVTGNVIIPTPIVPSGASDTGTTGTLSWDSDYIYICVGTNTWKRVTANSW